jgi:Ran GTPase-activating protein (RanGAP) involved in mRNA processing and transport
LNNRLLFVDITDTEDEVVGLFTHQGQVTADVQSYMVLTTIHPDLLMRDRDLIKFNAAAWNIVRTTACPFEDMAADGEAAEVAEEEAEQEAEQEAEREAEQDAEEEAESQSEEEAEEQAEVVQNLSTYSGRLRQPNSRFSGATWQN